MLSEWLASHATDYLWIQLATFFNSAFFGSLLLFAMLKRKPKSKPALWQVTWSHLKLCCPHHWLTRPVSRDLALEMASHSQERILLTHLLRIFLVYACLLGRIVDQLARTLASCFSTSFRCAIFSSTAPTPAHIGRELMESPQGDPLPCGSGFVLVLIISAPSSSPQTQLGDPSTCHCRA